MIELRMDPKSLSLDTTIYLIAPKMHVNKYGRARRGKENTVYPAIITGLSYGHNTGNGHYSADPIWLVDAVEIVPEDLWGTAEILNAIPADRCFTTESEANAALKIMEKERNEKKHR